MHIAHCILSAPLTLDQEGKWRATKCIFFPCWVSDLHFPLSVSGGRTCLLVASNTPLYEHINKIRLLRDAFFNIICSYYYKIP